MNLNQELVNYIERVLKQRKKINFAYFSKAESNQPTITLTEHYSEIMNMLATITLAEHYREIIDMLDTIIHELGMIVNICEEENDS